MKSIIKLFVCLSLVACATLVHANTSFPSFPMAFWGTASQNGQPLPSGTKIDAYCGANLAGEVTMLENGVYGYTESAKIKLLAGNCGENILFKYLLEGAATALTGGSEIKYADGFQAGAAVNKNLNFITIQSCAITNGTGSQVWTANGWSSCTLASCNSGFIQSGNTCVANHSSAATVAAGGGGGSSSSNVASRGGGGGGGGGGSYVPPISISTATKITGCDSRTTGFSTVTGQSCATNTSRATSNTTPRVIPGCDNRTTGFSVTTGGSCIGNTGTSIAASSIGQVFGAQSFRFTLLLRKGSSGNEVKELQKFLNDAGYNIGTVTGIFDTKLKTAVIKFQTASKLKPDGIVGSAVRVILNK